jgi:hypothetical protein
VEAQSLAKVFISHSSKDAAFVGGELVPFLKCNRYGTFYSKDDIRSGKEWESVVYKELEGCDKFVLVASLEASNSEWVKREVSWAMAHRRGRVTVLLIDDVKREFIHHGLPGIQHIECKSFNHPAKEKLLEALAPPWWVAWIKIGCVVVSVAAVLFLAILCRPLEAWREQKKLEALSSQIHDADTQYLTAQYDDGVQTASKALYQLDNGIFWFADIRSQKAFAYLVLGQCRIAQGKVDDGAATRTHDENQNLKRGMQDLVAALNIYVELDSPENVGLVNRELARGYFGQEEYDEALRYARDAEQAYREWTKKRFPAVVDLARDASEILAASQTDANAVRILEDLALVLLYKCVALLGPCEEIGEHTRKAARDDYSLAQKLRPGLKDIPDLRLFRKRIEDCLGSDKP